MLSLIFSLACGVAFLLRKTLLRGREGIMYPVWIAILIISILPLGINVPTPAAAAIEYTRTETGFNSESEVTEISTGALPDSTGTTDTSISVSETKTTGHFIYKLRRAMATHVGSINEISIALFALWLTGAAVGFVRALCKYTDSKKLMLANSSVCSDERILRILGELRQRMKIKRRVKLRIFDIESFMSPCICGFIFPTLYIESGCLSMSDKELECVLTHELTHMRRFDMITRLFCLFATSVHWFNPSAKKVRETVLEDCELSCDYNVVKMFGTDASGMYMGTILDFTERYSKHCKLVFKDGMSCGLFASEPSGAAFMKMRYANMKNYRGGKLMLVLASFFAAACIAVNIFALSCSSTVTLSTFGSAIKLSPAFDIMLRAYYDLDSNDYITPEMVDGIKSISVSVNREYDDRMLVEFTVNSDSRITRPLPQVSQTNYTENLMLAALWEHGENNPKTDKHGNAVYDLAHYRHFKAYYVLTDISTIEKNDTSDELGRCYVLDSKSSERELDDLHDMLGEVGLLDAWTITSTEFDVSSLGYFTNLESVEFIGLTPIGYEFPDSVKVTVLPSDGTVTPALSPVRHDVRTAN
ncbi:MAG: M56 family metallopeptidase [Clostridia bacterium]|nr:M56 family metallopeptidase [Clostridia bacterium]